MQRALIRRLAPARTGGADWDAMVARRSARDFGDGDRVVYGADPVTATDIRRFLEPLEFDSPAALLIAMPATQAGICRRHTAVHGGHVVVDPAHVVAGRPAAVR